LSFGPFVLLEGLNLRSGVDHGRGDDPGTLTAVRAVRGYAALTSKYLGDGFVVMMHWKITADRTTAFDRLKEAFQTCQAGVDTHG
jgi:hypothetical protein